MERKKGQGGVRNGRKFNWDPGDIDAHVEACFFLSGNEAEVGKNKSNLLKFIPRLKSNQKPN